jgi:hypothetical protein
LIDYPSVSRAWMLDSNAMPTQYPQQNPNPPARPTPSSFPVISPPVVTVKDPPYEPHAPSQPGYPLPIPVPVSR